MSSASPFSRPGLRSFLLRGGSLIALATFFEKGFLFLANVLSARIGGLENYGAYGLALQAAGFMAGQASLGIGTVAWRYAAEYPAGHELHRDYVHRIVYLSLGLAVLSALLMFIFAWPMANWFYDKPQFYPILMITVYSAPAFVMLDAVRGLMVGMSYYSGLVLLSSIFGITMLALMPGAAYQGVRWMIITQAICSLIASFTLLVILNRKFQLKLLSPNTRKVPILPMLRFGMLQLGTGTLINLVSMTLMAMLVRYGSREELIAAALVPMGYVMAHGTVWMINMGISHYPLFGFREVGFYNAANSIRNMVSILPGMLHQTMMSLLTNKRGEEFGGADRMMLINSWISAIFLMPVTAVALVIMSWLLPFIYGKGFIDGVVPACYLISVAMIHMVSQPVYNRLNVVNPRATFLSNIIWSIVVLTAAFFLVPKLGATGVTLALLISYVVSTITVTYFLSRHGRLPDKLFFITTLSMLGAVVPFLWLDMHQNTLLHWSNGLILMVAAIIMLFLWMLRGQLRAK